MTWQEYLNLSRGDVCEIVRKIDKDHGRLVKVRYIEEGCVVVKSWDKEPFNSTHGRTLRIMNWRDLRIVLKAVKESD